MKTVYLAAPLFSEAECDFNRKLRDLIIDEGYEVFLPQEDRKSTRLNSSHNSESRMPSSA
jgi:nucleoside 2-deoxyribosyltransferase